MGALEVEDGTHPKDVQDFANMPQSGEDIQQQDMNGDGLDVIKKEQQGLNGDVVKKEYSVEDAFASTAVPPWRKQITIRGLVVSMILGILFSIITLKLSLTTGIIPSLNVSAGLLGFFFVKSYTTVLSKFNISHVPFTRQENTVIQTCVVACYGIAFSGGFGSYLIGMDSKTYEQVHEKGGSDHDTTANIKDPQLGWIIAYMFAVGFLGLLAVVPLRKVFMAIALILGDGLYNFVKISFITLRSLYQNREKLPVKNDDAMDEVSNDDQRRRTIFMKDRIPFKAAAACYIVLAVVSTIVIPHIFHQVKWYFIFISYMLAPVLGFCNAYGCGLTDWSLVSTYGKLGLFIFSAWAGSNGGVLVGLVSCGVMMIVVSCAADLMQDFNTSSVIGHLSVLGH